MLETFRNHKLEKADFSMCNLHAQNRHLIIQATKLENESPNNVNSFS